MVIPTQNVIVYGALSGVYGLICLASLCILIRVILSDMKHRENYTKFIMRRFGSNIISKQHDDDHDKQDDGLDHQHSDDDPLIRTETSSSVAITTTTIQYEQQSTRTFSDKRLMFALISILSAVRSAQLAIQGSVVQFSEYRELLIIVSSMPGYVFASTMLMMIFFWTETLIISKRLLCEERKQNDSSCSTWFIAFITSSRFLKWLFFSINFVMYFVMVVNDCLLIYQFTVDSKHSSDYTDPTPYTAIEIVAVSIPTLLFIGCALLIFILGLILLRKYYKNYRTFSNVSALYIILYISIVTVTDIIVLIGRSSVLIAQIFLSWLETQWITIFCYFSIGEVIPLIILNFALWKMSSNSVQSIEKSKTVENSKTVTTTKQSNSSRNYKPKIKSMSRAAEYYTHWDESTEDMDAAVYVNREDYDNATERDVDSSTHSSSPQVAGYSNYGSTDQKSKSRSGSSVGIHGKISNPVPYDRKLNSPSHSFLNKVDSTMIGNNSLRNAYNEFTGVSD
ncbi:predicted protein [Naegleria gruberi]|uniref:Predicted protein n=1 Tax=Naegleria gruberi TaxID=5762 RepID=D2VEJ1_NAEGR|nr:uncharacterized protein NAEGRDRAFT_67296 [Naegleria gruberi]EFC44806.1 predicted protein [Naegleria gruberi]|eukprot:XP_002677550.1 predicted protein [Naegleria gruberi strain NEG-M]